VRLPVPLAAFLVVAWGARVPSPARAAGHGVDRSLLTHPAASSGSARPAYAWFNAESVQVPAAIPGLDVSEHIPTLKERSARRARCLTSWICNKGAGVTSREGGGKGAAFRSSGERPTRVFAQWRIHSYLPGTARKSMKCVRLNVESIARFPSAAGGDHRSSLHCHRRA
jgi:hypothetical protein